MIPLFGQPGVFYSSPDYMKKEYLANMKTLLSAFIYNLNNGIWGGLYS